MHYLEANAPSHPSGGSGVLVMPPGHGLAAMLMRTATEVGRALSSRAPWRKLQQLVTANRRKDELLAMVCHELRSPLASIRHAVRLLDSQAPGPLRTEMEALIMRQVRRMSTLVDDLLDVSRIANGRIQLQCERVDLHLVVSNAIQTMATDIAARRHQLTAILPEGPVWVTADPLRLEQVLVNLLGNAAKYTEVGGRIALSVESCNDQVIIRVRDNGIGIAPQLLPHVFDLFRQADGADTQANSGLGVGLAVVRSLIELQGGSVAAASRGSGQGSEFTVCLPLPDRAPDATGDLVAHACPG